MNFRARNLPRHAKFDYKPRYYDPDKERMEELRADYSTGDAGEKLKRQIAKGFGRQTRGSQFAFRTQRSAANNTSNKRLLITIVVISLIAYLVLSLNFEGLIAALNAK